MRIRTKLKINIIFSFAAVVLIARNPGKIRYVRILPNAQETGIKEC